VKNIFNFILIGIIQGFTEFLPISSSGHIVLFGSFLNLDNLLLISIVAHIGTLLAVVFCYRKRIFNIVRHPKQDKTFLHLIIATIPSVIIVLLFNSFLEKNFSTNSLVVGFIISAILLLVADFKKESSKSVNSKSALYMGISQGLALLPGFSRSGTTLACGLLVGVNKEETLDFSFLMSIPIILASAVYESFKLFSSTIVINWVEIFVVMLTSFIFGLLSIKFMLKAIKKNKLYYFSIYLIILSLILVVIY